MDHMKQNSILANMTKTNGIMETARGALEKAIVSRLGRSGDNPMLRIAADPMNESWHNCGKSRPSPSFVPTRLLHTSSS